MVIRICGIKLHYGSRDLGEKRRRRRRRLGFRVD